MNFLYAFLIGGTICVVGQLLLSLTSLTSARILVLFVTIGVILGAVGLYEPLVEFAGAGATVPLTGFGWVLAKGALEGANQSGLFGALGGGLTASAIGVSAAVVFGYVMSVVFKAKIKK